MRIENYSVLLQRAIDAFASLPGVGGKTALRLALYTLRQEKDFATTFCNSILDMVNEVRFCKRCHNISDQEICSICNDVSRDSSVLCVVEGIRELIAIESTGRYHGYYHIIGGIISPVDKIFPTDLFLDDLPKRVEEEGIREVILALSATTEGDTTNFYIYRLLEELPVKVSVLSRGVSVGDELEYADEVTLGRSIEHRIAFEDTLGP